MPDREHRGIAVMRGAAANDNPGSGSGAEAGVDLAVVTLARLIGRQIAREHFEATHAVNDNAPEKDAGER